MPAPRRAFDTEPVDWKDLQSQVHQFFTELGCDAHETFVAQLVRGKKELDVYVEDSGVTPPQTYAVECKLWKKAVEQETVHAFRTVCADLGVTIGFIVAAGGFQTGAKEAAVRTNIRLLSFHELQELFFLRWYAAMIQRLEVPMKALFPYWDPTGGRMPTYPWGDGERTRHEELLGQYRIVFDADHWVVSHTIGRSDGGTAAVPVPLPRTFTDPFNGASSIEVATFRQYFTLVASAYPELMREMRALHGEAPR